MQAVSKVILIAIASHFLSDSYAQRTPLVSPIDLYLPAPDSLEVQSFQQSRSVVRPIKVATWPLFCRLEEAASQQAKTQLRVRLGSVDYVDYLEGKTTSNPRP